VILNNGYPCDESAVEEAVLIKEAFSDTKIDIISVGPAQAKDVIIRTLGMGADDGIHISNNSAIV